jgi:hypothetical protein
VSIAAKGGVLKHLKHASPQSEQGASLARRSHLLQEEEEEEEDEEHARVDSNFAIGPKRC